MYLHLSDTSGCFIGRQPTHAHPQFRNLLPLDVWYIDPTQLNTIQVHNYPYKSTRRVACYDIVVEASGQSKESVSFPKRPTLLGYRFFKQLSHIQHNFQLATSTQSAMYLHLSWIVRMIHCTTSTPVLLFVVLLYLVRSYALSDRKYIGPIWTFCAVNCCLMFCKTPFFTSDSYASLEFLNPRF